VDFRENARRHARTNTYTDRKRERIIRKITLYYEIWGSHSHVADCSSLLECYAASTFDQQVIAFISKI